MAGIYPDWHEGELDFTIAQGLPDRLIDLLRDYFYRMSSSEVEVSRQTINADIREDSLLTKSDAERLFTGLVSNGAAQQATTASIFADYTFVVEPDRAVDVLDIQSIARSSLRASGALEESSVSPTVTFTGTFPPELNIDHLSEVEPLSDGLRKMFLDAKSVVRIANPYFDPSPSVVKDIASIANRGVQTKILTRETESADEKLRSTLNTMYENIEPSKRNLLQVRDLYRQDVQTGTQEYATHAKIAIVDSELCYIGSANLTDTSLSNNFELGLLLRGPNVEIAIDVFDTVFEFSSQVVLPLS